MREIHPVPKDRMQSGRDFGKRVEREVARRTGGERMPMSGAIKTSVRGLEGDVRVRDSTGQRDVFVIECKGAGQITPRGERTYVLKKSVLDQMVAEAERSGAIGLVYLHWKGNDFSDDYVIFRSEHFFRFLEAAKRGWREE